MSHCLSNYPGCAFNRTYEELKAYQADVDYKLLAFNRTYEELKEKFCIRGDIRLQSFNRTYEELKVLQKAARLWQNGKLLIVPMRN